MQRILTLVTITIYLIASIAGASYYAVEIRRLPAADANLLIGLILTILVGIPATYLLLLDRIRQHRLKHSIEAASDARIATLSRIPGSEPFLPLLKRGYLMTEVDLRNRIARTNALLAIPHRAPFANRIYEGFNLSDEQIDYLALPDRFALCEHFRPLESSLKQAGLASFQSPGRIVGNFRPNLEKFDIPPGITQTYIERSSYRDDDDHYLYQCPACNHTLIANCNGPLWP